MDRLGRRSDRRRRLRELSTTKDVVTAYEHGGYEPDEITRLYPDLSLGDVHRAH